MATSIKIDYEDILTTIHWDMVKAASLLDDIQNFFSCPDLEYPTREVVEAIRNDFKSIAVKISLVEDLTCKTRSTVTQLLDCLDFTHP